MWSTTVTTRWLKSLSGPLSLSLHWLSAWTGGVRLAAFIALLTLTACSGTPLSLLTGGGTNVAANTQLGRENTQTVGQDRRNTVEVRAPVETVDQSSVQTKTGPVENITISNIPVWVVLLLILGWILPSPGEIYRSLRRRKT